MRKVLKQLVGRTYLAVSGWRTEGERPAPPQFVLIAAPHTTNWDLLFFLACAWAFDVKVSWMGKHSLFRGPMGSVMRVLGGIPVRRDRAGGLVGQMTEAFERNPSLVITVPPEGTRAYVPYWKSGFYQIARAARVPIVMGFLDYERRVGGLGPALLPTDDLRADMDEIRAFYSDIQGLHPDRFGEIRLKEET